MKRYEFHSALPPERVFARLSVRAEENRCLDPWVGKKMFLYRRKEERFWLTYTGELPMKGFLPFRGKVARAQEGSLISGTFAPDPRFLGCVAGAIFCVVPLMGGSLWAAAVTAAVSFVWFGLVLRLIQLGFRDRREKISDFIQEYLTR